MLVVVEDEVEVELLVHGYQRVHAVIVAVLALEDEPAPGGGFHGVLQEQLVVVVDDEIYQRVFRVLDVEDELVAVRVAVVRRVVLRLLEVLR